MVCFFAMKHPALLTLVCLLFAGACWFVWAICRDSQLLDGFDKVRTGASESEVSAILGKPKRVEPCGEFYVVRLDASGRVLEAVPLSSP